MMYSKADMVDSGDLEQFWVWAQHVEAQEIHLITSEVQIKCTDHRVNLEVDMMTELEDFWRSVEYSSVNMMHSEGDMIDILTSLGGSYNPLTLPGNV